MKVKIDSQLALELSFRISSEGYDDVCVIDEYLNIDTESTKQDDFYSPLATELYQKYFLYQKIESSEETYGNYLYKTCYIQHDMMKVCEELIDLDYVPPKRSDIVWDRVKNIPDYSELPIVCLDIETIKIKPDNIENTINEGRIILIGLKTNYDEIIIKDKDEKKMLLALIEYLEFFGSMYGEWVVSGHNIFNFDLTVLYFSFKKHNIPVKMWLADFHKIFTYSSMNGQPAQYRPSKLYYGECSIIDTWLLAGAEEKRTNKISSFGLKDLALSILGKEERRLELSYEEIESYYYLDKLEIVEVYLTFDIRDQRTLTDFFLPPIYYLKTVVNLSIQELHYSSVAHIWEFLLEEWYKPKTNLSLIEPEMGYSFKGALTGVSPGLYKNVSKLDVSSLYPSIMLRYELCPLKDYEGVFLRILEYILKRRLEIKNSKESDMQYFQLALKILINGGYGFTGTQGKKFNCYKTAALVTTIGRLLLMRMIKKLIDIDVFIIEVDTDGLIIDSSEKYISEIYKEVQDCLPQGISIGIDWQDRDVFVPKAKNYIIYKPDGKYSPYGIYKKRNRSLMEREFTIEYVRAYLESKEKAYEYYNQCCLRVFLGDIDYIKNRQRIPKRNKSLLHLGRVGQIIEFYVSEKQKFHKTTGKQCKSEKIAVRLDSGEPIWSEYYIEKLRKIKNEIDDTINKSYSEQLLVEDIKPQFEVESNDAGEYDYDDDPF